MIKVALDIATGQMTSYDALQPLNDAGLPGVAPPTAVSGLMTPADQTPERDLTGERLSQLAGYEQDISAAQAAGMAAEHDRRAHYAADILPVGAAYGDTMDLPPVATNAVPPSASSLYPEQGDEPTIAGGPFGGDEPL